MAVGWLADGRRGKATKGGHIGGTAPFGYRVEGAGKAAILVPVPAEQEALETIYRETEAWGERYFQATDPNGVVIQLVQWVEQPQAE